MHSTIHILNTVLADTFVLYVKTLKYHWNVRGVNFGPLHALFNKHYDTLAVHVDSVAERIRMLGDIPVGTCKEFVELAGLKEQPGNNPKDAQMLKDLLSDHTSLISTIKKAVAHFEEQKEAANVDFATGLIQEHEKMAWFLKAHLEQ